MNLSANNVSPYGKSLVFNENGIGIDDYQIKENQAVEIYYNGLLAQSGAQEIYVHCGSSILQDWIEIKEVKMTKNSEGIFTATVTIPDGKVFNMCFRDNAYNWDNNSGANYSYRIH